MKKIYKNLNAILAIGLFAFLLVNCENDVDNMNNNPNTFSTIDPGLQVETAKLGVAALLNSDGGRYSALYANHVTGNFAQFINAERYSFTATDFNGVWQTAYFDGGLNQSRNAKINALKQGQNGVAGEALLYEAIQLGELTAWFGDVPDTKAIFTSNPTYDKQEDILKSVQKKLDSVLTLNSIFEKEVHSLKARYALIQKDYVTALSESKLGISSRNDDFVLEHTDIAGAKNLWYQFGVEQRALNIIGEGSYLYDMLEDATRLLETPGDSKRFAYYYDNGDMNYNEGGVFSPTSPSIIISWYETKLIEAEAAYRTGDSASALTALNEVRAELAVQFSDSFPDSTASGDTLLKHILEEKYITLFCQAQVMHDLSRTENFIGVRPKTGTKLPYRFLYPQDEITGNSNVPTNRPDIFTNTPINQ